MITSWPLDVAPASGVTPYTSDRHQQAIHQSSKVMLHFHIPTVASYLTDEQCLITRCAVHRPPPSSRPISLDHSLQVHLKSRLITASKCISKLSWSPPPSVSPNSLDYGLQVRTSMASKCISILARSGPPSASSISLDHGLQVHLQTRSITASKCISEFTRSRPLSASLSSLNPSLQLHLQTCSNMASVCISEFTRSSSSGAPQIADNHRVLSVQIYRLQIGSYIDT